MSYRTTREILSRALSVVSGEHFDDLDDGSDTLAGYRSVLHGPAPTVTDYDSWNEEIAALAATLRTWLAELATSEHGVEQDPRGCIAVCVADREAVHHVMRYLSDEAGITCAELTKEGPRDGQSKSISEPNRCWWGSSTDLEPALVPGFSGATQERVLRFRSLASRSIRSAAVSGSSCSPPITFWLSPERGSRPVSLAGLVPPVVHDPGVVSPSSQAPHDR
ncbi:hypothetical protein [Actinopolyspora mzabensis]|uniref:hypothetical protein n=1 Tax=Actinopolyspora mzabensis TaxID=995066 RepID=UPI00115F8463|nr:hypothetical protein [Actinopolyspora mzabensis]